MKNILTFLILMIAVRLLAQDYPVSVNLTVPANPDANTSNWGNGSQLFIINAKARTDPRGNLLPQIIGCKILVTLKKSGTKICGIYTPQTAPASNFTSSSKTWTGGNAVGLLGQDCTLSPGEYSFCVQFFDVKGNAISNESCKPIVIIQRESTAYQPPQAISPADGTVIQEADAKKPVTFRWTPVTPRPATDVIYKLRIVEVRQGQTATTVVKSAIPLLEKELKNLTQFVLPSLSQLTAAKGSSFAWTVQAVDIKGKPIGTNNGMSGISLLDLGGACLITNFTANCTGNFGSYHYSITVHNTGSETLEITGISSNSNFSSSVSIGTITVNPSLTSNPTIPVEGELTFSGTFTYSGNYPAQIGLVVEGVQSDGQPAVCSGAANIPICLCGDCEDITWNFGEPVVTTQTDISPNLNNIIYLSQNINVTPVPIIRMKAEIVNLYWYSLFNDCKKCNTNSYYWGNLTQGTLNNTGFAASGFPPGIPGGANFPNSHELLWNTPAGQSVTLDGVLKLNISIPPQTELSCCIDCFRFGIRYSITFIEDGKCITCSNIKFYEVQRQHHQVLPFSENGPDECGETGPSQE